MQFFSISENGIVVCHPDGIYLYHIPELESVDDYSVLSPAWSWSGESTRYHGSLYDVWSKFPKLSIQGSRNLHKLEFSLEPGFPVVLRHNVTRGLPRYCIPDDEWGTAVKGRKWARHYQLSDIGTQILVATLLLEREDEPGGFSVRPGFSMNEKLEVKYMDVDEATGRFLFGMGRRGLGRASKLWLVDPFA